MNFANKPLLDQSFYARDSIIVAQDLLGKLIVANDVVLRITETEAYCWPNDSASHCFKGKTGRNAVMFGAPGHAYIYLCYGLHIMLNVVTNKEGEGAGVLIRSCEPILGHNIISERRNKAVGISLLAGPGRVTMALNVDRSLNGHPLFSDQKLTLRYGPAVEQVLVGPRIGIDYALKKDREALYRFADAASTFVSHKQKFTTVLKPFTL
jgi:DNA-3-methyladenine glycosylase